VADPYPVPSKPGEPIPTVLVLDRPAATGDLVAGCSTLYRVLADSEPSHGRHHAKALRVGYAANRDECLALVAAARAEGHEVWATENFPGSPLADVIH
jgi:hypothetical protein